MKKQKENSHEGITWSEMGKQNVQAEKVYCFLLVEVGAPNDCRAASVGCFDDEVVSVFEINEGNPFFFGKFGEFGVAIRF